MPSPEITILLLGNGINLFGVIALTYSNFVISLRPHMPFAFGAAAFGGTLVATGSMILGSYPIVLLNVCWALIGVIGTANVKWPLGRATTLGGLVTIAVAGVISFSLGQYSTSAYATSAIYVLAFFLFSLKSISRLAYMTWCCVGFVLLVPHLVQVKSVFVLANETLGFVISFAGIASCLIRRWRQKNEAIAPAAESPTSAGAV